MKINVFGEVVYVGIIGFVFCKDVFFVVMFVMKWFYDEIML